MTSTPSEAAAWWPQALVEPWLQAQRTMFELWQAAPQVVAMRLAWLATPPCLWTSTQQAEAWRMVTEKQAAIDTGMRAMGDTLGRGLLDPLGGVTLAPRLLTAGLSPAHREVHDNLNRLERRQRRPATSKKSR